MRVTDSNVPSAAPQQSKTAVAVVEPVVAEPAADPARDGAWSQLAGKFEGTVGRSKTRAGLAHELWDDRAAASLHVHNDPALPVPPDTGGLRIASFNIQLGGRLLDRVEAELRALSPDVACLRECSPQSAQRLSRELSMHVAWFAGGKAILSRYPITDAQSVNLPGALDERLRASFEHRGREPQEARSVLRATLRVGGRAIDVLDTHLALGDEISSSLQLERISRLVAEREELGHAVLLAGDLSDGSALARASLANEGLDNIFASRSLRFVAPSAPAPGQQAILAEVRWD